MEPILRVVIDHQITKVEELEISLFVEFQVSCVFVVLKTSLTQFTVSTTLLQRDIPWYTLELCVIIISICVDIRINIDILLCPDLRGKLL